MGQRPVPHPGYQYPGLVLVLRQGWGELIGAVPEPLMLWFTRFRGGEHLFASAGEGTGLVLFLRPGWANTALTHQQFCLTEKERTFPTTAHCRGGRGASQTAGFTFSRTGCLSSSPYRWHCPWLRVSQGLLCCPSSGWAHCFPGRPSPKTPILYVPPRGAHHRGWSNRRLCLTVCSLALRTMA